MHHRVQAFGRLKALVLQWAAPLGEGGLLHDIDVRAYGSYEMGIDNDTSDIDCCVWVGRGADARLTKELFFEEFPRWLGGSAKIIAASKVPLISAVINEIEFEICFYRETGDRDGDGIYSRLAVETTTAILDAVPDVARFVRNVREVKQWAQDQGIYNSKLGYLGGIHIAVMVAAHHKEKGEEGDYVTQFCKYYGTEWKWPTPVKLTQYYWKGPHENLVWNPVNVPAHRKHIMPVLTPVYPFSNITYATTKATFSKMMACFAARLGIEPSITTTEEEKQATYRIVVAENSDGLIESRIYRLVARLEEHSGVQVFLDDHSSSSGGSEARQRQRWTLNVAAPEDSTAFFESAVSWWKKFVLDKCAVAVSGFASGDLSLQVTLLCKK